MQHFRDNEKKQLKLTVRRSFGVLFLPNFLMCYPCASPYIVFYVHGPAILLCLLYIELRKYNKIPQIQNGR